MSKIADAFVELKVKGATAVQSALGNIGAAMRRLGEAAAEMAKRFGRAMKGFADAVGAGFVNRWKQFVSMMQNAKAFTAGLVGSFASAGMAAGKALVSGIAGRVGAAAGAIRQKLAGALAGMTLGNLDTAMAKLLFRLNDLPGAVRSGMARAGAAVRAFGADVASITRGSGQLLAGLWGRFAQNTTARFNAVRATVSRNLQQLQARIDIFRFRAQAGLTAPFYSFAAWMQSRMPRTWGQLNTGFQMVANAAKSAAGKMKQTIGAASGWIASHVPKAFKKAMSAAGGAVSRLGNVAGAVASGIASAFTTSLNGVQVAAEAAGAAIQAMYLNFVPVLGPIFSTIKSGISSVIGLCGKLASALLKPFKMLTDFVFSFKGLLASLGVSLGAAAIGKYIVDVTADAEKAQVAFATMLGGGAKGAAQARALLNDLQKLGDTTPLEMPELRQGARNLLAMGVPAAELTKTLRMIGDVSQGVQVPLEHIAQIYGKISLQNKIMGDDLRQLSDNGIPLVAELAKKYGTTTAAIYKMSEQGKLSFKDLQEVFQNLTSSGGRFNNMLGQMGQTIGGRFSTLKDTIRSIAVSIGEAISPALKKALDSLIAFAESVKSKLEPVKRVLSNIANEFAARLPTALKFVGSLIPVVVEGFKAVGAVIRAAAEIASEVGRAIAGWLGGVNSVKGGITGIIREVRFLAENWRAAWEIVMAYWKNAGESIKAFAKGLWGDIKSNVKVFFESLPTLFGIAVGAMGQVLGPFIDSVAERIQWAMTPAWMRGQKPEIRFGDVGIWGTAFQNALKQTFAKMPGFNFREIFNLDNPDIKAAVDRFKMLGKVFDLKEKMQPWLDAVGKFWDKIKAGQKEQLDAAAAASRAVAGASSGKFDTHGLAEYAKHLQQNAGGGANPAKTAENQRREMVKGINRQAAILEKLARNRRFDNTLRLGHGFGS